MTLGDDSRDWFEGDTVVASYSPPDWVYIVQIRPREGGKFIDVSQGRYGTQKTAEEHALELSRSTEMHTRVVRRRAR